MSSQACQDNTEQKERVETVKEDFPVGGITGKHVPENPAQFLTAVTGQTAITPGDLQMGMGH